MIRRSALPFALAVFALAFAGCEMAPELNDPVRFGPYYTPKNYSGEAKLPADLRRVLVLPVSVGTLAPEETATSLDAIVAAALQRQQRFEVVSLARMESLRLFGEREFASTGALPHGFIEQLLRRYAVDAVVFTDITVYNPIRPQSLGLRSKLVTVRDVRVVWSFDEIVSGADPAVANLARREALKGKGMEPIDRSPATLLSPSRFAAFAADAMFRTLPSR